MAAPALRQDLLFRAPGLASLAVAAGCLHALARDPAALHGAAGARQAAEATVAFLGATGGSALALLGGHLRDQVVVSPRWRTRQPIN